MDYDIFPSFSLFGGYVWLFLLLIVAIAIVIVIVIVYCHFYQTKIRDEGDPGEMAARILLLLLVILL